MKGSYYQKSVFSNYFSLFGCLHSGSIENEDPGLISKIFQNLYII